MVNGGRWLTEEQYLGEAVLVEVVIKGGAVNGGEVLGEAVNGGMVIG